MKFSSQILDKSVPEWKHNNIDYDKVKTLIKSKPNDCNSLVASFKDQFEIVNIFISMKIKEISTRIMSIESAIITLSQDYTELEENVLKHQGDLKFNKNLLVRKLKMIRGHTNNCTKELEKLSRFNILQKVATKKLFQKISKYYETDDANQLIQKISKLDMYCKGYENFSFHNIDLNPYFLELSLIVDVTKDLNVRMKSSGILGDKKKHVLNGSNNSITKGSTDYLMKEASLRANSYQFGSHRSEFHHNNNNNNNDNNKNTKSSPDRIFTTLEYDRIFLGESEGLQKFMITTEDTEEFKFMLLASSFQLFDEDIFSVSRDIVRSTSEHPHDDSNSNHTTDNDHHLHLKKSVKSLRSYKSFKDIPNIKSFTSLVVNPQDQFNIDGLNGPQNLNLTRTATVNKKNFMRYQLLDNIENNNGHMKTILNDNSLNRFPNIVLTTCDEDQSVTMCHVGGIRDHYITDDLDKDALHNLFTHNKKGNINVPSTSHICKLIVDWIQSHNLQYVNPTIDFRRSRFVSYHQNNIYMLTLSEDIMIAGSIKFPYNIFELRSIKKKTSTKFLDKLYSNIIDKKISCYPLPSELTLWRLALESYHSDNSLDRLFALVLKDQYSIDENNKLAEDEFFMLGNSATIDLCSHDVQLKYNELLGNSVHSVSNNKVSKLPPEQKNNIPQPAVRYWNEFDDEENQDFYQPSYADDESQSLLSSSNDDRGFIRFDKTFIRDLYNMCQKVKNTLTFNRSNDQHMERFRARYGSMVSTSEDLERLIAFRQQDIDDSASTYEFKHDEMITLLYICTLVVATIITGVALTIVITLFREESHNIDVPHETALITAIISSLVFALISIITSLLLLFSRFTLAPTWHYISGFVMFSIITVGVCYGIIEIYF